MLPTAHRMSMDDTDIANLLKDKEVKMLADDRARLIARQMSKAVARYCTGTWCALRVLGVY